MSKHVESKIQELAQATSALQQQVAARKIDESAYNAARAEINVLLLEIALGAEFKEKHNSEFTISFNQPLPNKPEVVKTFGLIDEFVNSVETADASAATDPDDMDIPTNVGNQLPAIEKVSPKSLKKAIFGGDGQMAILQMYLGPNDFLELTAWGEIVRKKKNVWTWIIAGASSALVIGGGITAGVIIASHYKKKAEKAEDTDTVAEIETTEVIDDIPDTVDLDDIEVNNNELY